MHWQWKLLRSGGQIEAEGREWGRVLGEGPQAPPHQLGGLGRAVSSPSGVRGEAPAAGDFGAF